MKMSNAFLVVTPTIANVFANTSISDIILYAQSNTQSLHLGVNSSGGSNSAIRITSNAINITQPIGIGTTTPSRQLHVVGPTPNIALVTTNTDAPGQISGIEFGIPASVRSKITATSIGGDKSDLTFTVQNGPSTPVNAMRIVESGNLAIGTVTPTDPNAKLQIAGDGIANQLTFSVTNQGLNGKHWGFGPNTSDFYGYIMNDSYVSTTNWLKVSRSGSNITSVNFPFGNVGIGTTSPGFPLDVAGSIRASGVYANGGFFETHTHTGSLTGFFPMMVNALSFSGYGNGYAIQFRYAGTIVGSVYYPNGSSVQYNTTSDYRLKHNFGELNHVRERVLALKPKTFSFIADPNQAVIEGFVAHEVQQIVPGAVTGEKDAVNEDGSIQPQGMDASKLVPLLTAAIQDLYKEIDLLKSKNEALEERLAAAEL